MGLRYQCENYGVFKVLSLDLPMLRGRTVLSSPYLFKDDTSGEASFSEFPFNQGAQVGPHLFSYKWNQNGQRDIESI